MKYIYKLSAATLFLLPVCLTNVLAETAPAAVTAPAETTVKEHKHSAGTEKMTEEQKKQRTDAMKENLHKTRELTSQINAEKDPGKKEELKKQLLELMKSRRAEILKQRAK
jgi:membrane-associated HD superfamily phosphohydrolase